MASHIAVTEIKVELPSPKSLRYMLHESTVEEWKQLLEHLVESSEVLQKEALKADIVTSLARAM